MLLAITAGLCFSPSRCDALEEVHTVVQDFLRGQYDGGTALTDTAGGEVTAAPWGRLASDGFQPVTSLPYAAEGVCLVASHGWLYAAGGWDGASALSSVYRAEIGAAGGLGAWQACGSLAAGRAYAGIAVANEHVFIAGGWDGTAVCASVYSAAIAADGSLGSWQPVASLPAAARGLSLVAAEGRLFACGGQLTSGDYTGAVYAAAVTAHGELQPWAGVSVLPEALAWHGTVRAGSHIYVAGGVNALGARDAVYSAQLTPGGLGAWYQCGTLATPSYGAAGLGAGGHLMLLGGDTVSGPVAGIAAAALAPGGGMGSWYATPADTDILPKPLRYHACARSSDWVYAAGGYSSSGGLSSAVYCCAIADGCVGPVAPVTSLVEANGSPAAAANSSHAYILGGRTSSGYTAAAYCAAIAQNGSLGPWTSTTALPVARAYACAAATDTYVYFIGGESAGSPSAAVYRAAINPDGSLGAWSATSSLPGPRSKAALIVAGEYLVLSGGYNGYGPTFDVYYAHINANGSLGAWQSTTDLPVLLQSHAMAATAGRAYVLGGDAGRGGVRDDVYHAQINGNGTLGAWTATTSIPAAMTGHAAFGSDGYVAVVGGLAGGSYRSHIHVAKADGGGALGAWSTPSALPLPIANHGAALGRGYIFTVGGANALGRRAECYSAPKPGANQLSRFCGRFTSGSEVHFGTLAWTGNGWVRYRIAPFATGIYGAWSDYLTSGAASVEANAGYLEYEIAMGTWPGDPQDVSEISVTLFPVAPGISSPVDGAVTNDPACTVSGTAPVGSTVTVYDNDVEAGSGGAPDGTFAVPITLVEGVNVLKATATTGEGTSPFSNEVTVTLDTQPPTCALTAPADGAYLRGAVTVSATANDNRGVTKVEFYVASELRNVDFAAPYSWQWNTPDDSDGPYTVEAIAYDEATNTASDSRDVNVDNTPPHVSSTDPTNGQESVALTADVVAVFDDVMDPATIGTGTFVLEDQYGAPVSGSVSYDSGTHAATFDPDANFEPGRSYTATLKGGTGNIADMAGNVLAADYVWSFTAGDDTPPTVAITDPSNGATVSWIVGVTADADDNMGVTRVEFYVNDALEFTDDAAPYQYDWQTVALPETTYTLKAVAWDASDNYAEDSVTVTVDNTSFDDVPWDFWARRYIEAIKREGITGGCAANPPLYCPTNSVRRDQMAVFLVRAMGLTPLDPETPTFVDVPKTYWAYQWIEALVASGVTSGCIANPPQYCPEREVRRDQMAVFLVRALGLTPLNPETPTFVDVPKTYWAYQSIEALVASGVTSGCIANPPQYCPERPVRRDQMAIFLCRAFDIPY
ncbi:MAG: Ig-like domain-containing protein [Armatimonadota bacterium]|nr:MAG: Ig-like domain-containing protein [Armatimonadota bacterium]